VKFLSLENVAQQFASKEKSIALIFNHSSAAEVSNLDFRNLHIKIGDPLL
jgi:hypothetical protein